MDEANFHLALQCLRERFPSGIRAVFEASDQQFYGFWLVAVHDREGRNVFNAAEPHDWQKYLDDLDWDGVMGEDEHGQAEVLLSVLRIEGVAMRERQHPAGHHWERTSIVDEGAIDHERQVGSVKGVGSDVVRVRVAQREDFDLLSVPVTRQVSRPRITLGETFELTPEQARELAQVLLQAVEHAERVGAVPWRPRLVSKG